MKRNWTLIALAGLLTLHFAWLAWYVVPGYASPDADGYFTQAQLIANHGRTTMEIESPVAYSGAHWLEAPGNILISRYPPGLPAVLATAWKLLGRDATFYVNPLLCTLTLLFLFLLCRPYVGERLALAAAGLYAVVPLSNQHAIHSDSHTASAFFVLTGLYALDAWLRNGAWWRAALAGLTLGFIPAVRYAEAVVAIGVIALLALSWDRIRTRPAELAALLVAASLPALFLAFRNQAFFGSFWKTGYALTNEQQITWDYLQAHWRLYVKGLLGSGAGPFAALGLAGFAGMLTRRETRAIAAGVALIAAALTAVYSGYYFARGPEGASMRFLLPTMPLYLLPAMWLFRQFSERRLAAVALGAVALFQVIYCVPESSAMMRREKAGAARAAETIVKVEEQIPLGSVIAGDRTVLGSLYFTGRWKFADATFLTGGPGGLLEQFMRRRGASDRPSPMQATKGQQSRAAYRDLSPEEHASLALADLREWAAGREVYWIGDRSAVRRFESLTAGDAEFDRTGEIEIETADAQQIPGLPGRPGNMRDLLRQRFRAMPGPPPVGRDFGPRAGLRPAQGRSATGPPDDMMPPDQMPPPPGSSSDPAEFAPPRGMGFPGARGRRPMRSPGGFPGMAPSGSYEIYRLR